MENSATTKTNRALIPEQPSRWQMRLLQTICPAQLLEEIEGDLLQRFQRDCKAVGIRKARKKLTWNIVRYIRPGILMRNKFPNNMPAPDMITNYFKMAVRNMMSSKFYSALNIGGLTLGLAVGLLILLWINNELNYDSFHTKGDQLYQLNVNLESSGTKFTVSVVQAPIAGLAMKEIPGIENAVRVMDVHQYAVLRYKDIALKNNVMYYADPSLFKLFDYKFISGNKDKPYIGPFSVVLTKSAAKKYFGDEDPMGKILIADNETNFVVNALIEDFPDNGWLHGDMLFSPELLNTWYAKDNRGTIDEDWGNYGWNVYLQLRPGLSIKETEEKLSKINYRQQPGMKPIDAGSYSLQPLKDIHLYNPDGSPGIIKTIKIFSFVAALILFIASINYVNLSTARAVLRAKEVTVRKIIGATRRQLFIQFVVQTLLFFSLALLLAFGLMALSMPLYNEVAGKQLHFEMFNPVLWKVIGITMSLTLLTACIYPALLLSSFNPVQSLRGKLSWGIGSVGFRKVLVVGQFAFSICLIICTIIMSRQLNLLQNKELGFDKSYLLMVGMDDMESHYDNARAELLSNPAITAVSSANGNIVQRWGATLDISWDGKDPNGSFFIHDMIVDKDFMPMMKFEMVAGSAFTGAVTDSTHFILNETAVAKAGIKDPVGKRFSWHRHEGTIIGVVKDFNFVWAKQKIEPFVFVYNASNAKLYVKTTGKNVTEAIAAVNKTWSKFNPQSPFDYQFVDDTYKRMYNSDKRNATLFTVFTGIAIVISCIGLLGLAAYAAQTKIKEIGIRKVLGASVAKISFMLSSSFLSLVGIAIIIATPASWYLMREWLKDFDYQTSMSWWIFVAAGMASILVAVATIGFQSVRAALENPVKSLRSE